MPITAEVARANGAKGGRPVGAATRRTRQIANELALTKRAPLDVMLKNMLWWHETAESMTKQINELLIQLDDFEARREAIDLLRKMLIARENSQRCAVDAAPYCHPRLASVTLKGDKENPLYHEIKNGMTAKEAAEAYAGS